MHNSDTLDVINIIERLEGGGVPPDQAKVQAAVLVDVVTGECRCMDARYVTRDDLDAALSPLKSGIQMLDAKIDRLAIENQATTDRLGSEIKGTADRLGSEIKGTADRLGSEIKGTADRLGSEIKGTAERLEMRIDKTAADIKTEIMKWTFSVWFLQTGLFTALLFKLAT